MWESWRRPWTNVAKELMAPYFSFKGHTLFTDPFSTIVLLFEYLCQNDTFGCSMVIKNWDNSPEISRKDLCLQKREHVVHRRNDAVAVQFHDREDFMLVSTKFNGNMVDMGKHQHGTYEPVLTPKVVIPYNNSMNDDQFDQNMTYYSFSQKTMKWWKRAANHFIQAFNIIYKKNWGETPESDFTLGLIKHLVGNITVDNISPELQNTQAQHTQTTGLHDLQDIP